MELTFCYPPYSPLTLKNIDENCLISELKSKLFSVLPGVEGSEGEMRLVCGGKVLQDHLNLSAQGVGNGAKIYVAVKKTTNTMASRASLKPTNSGKSESDPLMGQLLKFLSDNPELYQQMLMSNPQMQKLIEKNPELRHALSDPATLKSMLNVAANPTAYNEMLRGHDRAMSNLENIPEGFSHLKKVYSTLQEPMYDAFTPKMRVNYNTVSGEDQGKVRTTTSEPVPNPWAPKTPTPMRPSSRQASNPVFGFKAHAQKRKLSASIDEDDELFNRSLAGMGLASPLNGQPGSNFGPQLTEMRLMGFVNDEENMAALVESGGDVLVAIDRIMAKRGEKKQ